MAHILIMPRQGNTVESCVIVEWKIKEGDEVTADTIVCEVETDKASFEIPAGAAGTVIKILSNEGDDVPVLAPIAVIGIPGEEWEGSEEAAHKDTKAQRSEAEVKIDIPSPLRVYAPSCESSSEKISPRARNLAEKEALSLDKTYGSGPEGRIIERDVLAALENRPPLTAAAKAAAQGTVPAEGSGLGGKVTMADISIGRAARPEVIAHHPAPHSTPPAETAIKGIRKVIADRMLKSLAETAQFTLNASAPASRLQDIRSRMKTPPQSPGTKGSSNHRVEGETSLPANKITVNDLILFAVSRTLPGFPFMNAHKTGEIIKTFEMIHLGIAVDTPRGLMVPVIRNANLLSLTQISSESKRLAEACQNGTAKPDELSGSTFTVTNLGSLGITSFTPVLNTPEVGILGVCGIEMKLASTETNKCCSCRFEPHIGFSLTINHQVVDGAPAARFLKALCEAVSNIDLLLAAG